MAELKRARIPMPSAGMNTIAAPGNLPDGKAPLVQNFLPHFPGKLVMRGPVDGKLFSYITKKGSVANKVLGVWTHNERIALGYNEGGMIPPWKTPYIKIEGKSVTQTQGRQEMAFIDPIANQNESLALTKNKLAPCGRNARIEDTSYGFGAGWETFFSDQRGYYQAIRPFLKWDGNKTTPVELTTAPDSGQFVKTFVNRLWVLGGRIEAVTGVWRIFPVQVSGGVAGGVIYSMNKEKGEEAGYTTYFAVGTEVKGAPGGKTSKVKKITVNVLGNAIEIETEATLGEIEYLEAKGNTKKYEPNTLFFSDAGGPLADELKYWQDDVSGLINRIIVGDDDRNDFGVALAVVDRTLIIFKRRSVWALYGADIGPSSISVKNLTYEFGCIDPWSVCETHYGVYFYSQKGLIYFNGETFNQVDEEISTLTLPLAKKISGDEGDQETAFFGRISVEDIGGGYLMLAMAKQRQAFSEGKNAGTLHPEHFTGIMHYETGNWATFECPALGAEKFPVLVSMNNQRPWIYDSDRAIDVASVTAVNEDVNLDKAASTAAIPAKVQTDRIVLSTPGYNSQLHRLMQDYTWPNGANDGAAEPGWWWGLTDGDGTVIQAAVQLPGHGYTETKYLRGRRWELDNFNELMDARLEIEWKSSSLEVRNPELFDCTLEFVLTQQRRTR